MKDRFFSSALSAAKKGPEAFLAEFKKLNADANVKEYYEEGFGRYGEPLIHSIIQSESIPDVQLPPLINILIQHGVNLESEDGVGNTPLSLAARYNKIMAVNFLIQNNAIINRRKKPPLCSAIYDFDHTNQHINLEMVKILLKHGANINIQDEFSQSALFHAAEEKSFHVTHYLLSQGANLFLKYTYASKTQHKTALCEAYDGYISARHCFPEHHTYTQRAKKCLDLHIQAVADYLYREGLKKMDEELFINNAIQDLSGHYKGIYPESNSNSVKDLLEKNIKPAVLARIRADKAHAFCMGSKLSKAQLAQKTIPPIYRFFQNDGRKDLTREIFSFVRPRMRN